LTVSTSNGFEPTSGEVFNVLSYPSYAGEFTCLNLDLGGGFLLEPQFNGDGLALVTTTYVVGGSEPHLLISVSGNNATLQWPLGYPDWTVQTTTNPASPSGRRYTRPAAMTPSYPSARRSNRAIEQTRGIAQTGSAKNLSQLTFGGHH
jgi:hypothetical protein